MRVIVSGTRHATDTHRAEIGRQLRRYARQHLGVLVHGAARGVDSIAADLASTWGWQVEPHPAGWDTCSDLPRDKGGCPPREHLRRGDPYSKAVYCPYAGHRRNQSMVDLGADLVLAFPAAGVAGRSGTWDLCHRAADAGLHVQIWPLAVNR